jgi:Spy/CpxP family protein refolding chaperone
MIAKRLCVCVALLLAMGFVGQAAQAKDREKKQRPEKVKSVLRGEHAEMVKELQLSAEQQTQLEQAVTANQAAMKAWYEGENGQKLRELGAQMKQAKGDKEKQAALRKEIQPLNASRAELSKQAHDRVMAVLTPEQQQRWAGCQLYRGLARRYKKYDLTDQQASAIRTACDAAAPQIGQLKEGDRKAKGEILKQLQQNVNEQIITDEQRQKMAADAEKAKQRRHKPGKDKPEQDNQDG